MTKRNKENTEELLKALIKDISNYNSLWVELHKKQMCPTMDNPSVYALDKALQIIKLINEFNT